MDTFRGFERGKRIVRRSRSPLLLSEQDGEVPVIPVIKRGKGPYVYDYDNNRYIDLFLSGGSLIFGHSHPGITAVAKSWMSRGYAAGYPTVSHDALSRRYETLLRGHLRDSDGMWLFFDSVSEAMGTVAQLIRTDTMKTVIVTDGDTPAGFRLWGPTIQLRPADAAGRVEELQSEESPCVILRCNRSIRGETVTALLEKIDMRRTIIVTDETDFSSFMHTSALKRGAIPGIRIFGTWLGGGFDFGALYMKTELFPLKKLVDRLREYRGRMPTIFPPLYKLKVSLKFLRMLETAGGISGLEKRYAYFASKMDTSIIESIDGLLYLKTGLVSRYRDLRKKLMERGLLLPLKPSDPISLSFTHEERLLDKAASIINSVGLSVLHKKSTTNDTG